MKKYAYPEDVTEENFEQLVERAKKIASMSSITVGASVIISLVLVVAITLYLFSIIRMAQNIVEFAWISLAMSTGIALFVVAFLIECVNLFLRRVYNGVIPYYPRPEEFVFAQFILTANLFSKEKSQWARLIRYRSMYMSEEISRFTKYDPLNFRRKVYGREFKLLASGQTQIGRMLLFSETKKKELLSKFALEFVNDEDSKAYLSLNKIVKKVEEYGELEGLTKRILDKLTKWQTVVTLIGGAVMIIATLINLFVI
jgi:hypothetical protein